MIKGILRKLILLVHILTLIVLISLIIYISRKARLTENPQTPLPLMDQIYVE